MPLPERYWVRFCTAIGRPEWADDERYTSTAAMREHGPELLPEIDAIFREQDLASWRERLDDAGCIWSPIATPFEVVRDPQLRQRGAFERVTQPDGRSYEVLAAPFKIRGADIRARGAAPEVGAHTHAVLADYGFSEPEVAELAAQRVLG